MDTAYARRLDLIPPIGVLGRVYAAGLVVNLPILALLLTPQIRSRVGSEATMAVSAVALLGLVVAAVVFAPEVSARVAPAGARWRFGGARAQVRALIRRDRRAYAWCLGEFVVLYIAAQGLGGVIGWMMPPIWSNADFGSDPAAGRWEFHYPNFAVQAVTIYVVICLAGSWYACRLRQLALSGTDDR
ncbi:hypothetical protein CP967_09185 [Streptomyces nitrosporeus]|uniref:Uncharacterized protein n=1 Tax=Streptomyces nitrosporeus TaxID=28894 RepID=A0A5J6F7H1_9ACTN|nr:hypothetical protein [Streptomyces nitrosporeus]QEU72122.1 hypothetical protein CP967_09185 [Streptomyces nitrosporeus]GGY80351.1 hypothetical protein GCM10010327_08670 [Streptomyces nitrosporeus]